MSWEKKKKSMNLKIGQLRSFSLRNKKKKRMKTITTSKQTLATSGTSASAHIKEVPLLLFSRKYHSAFTTERKMIQGKKDI